MTPGPDTQVRRLQGMALDLPGSTQVIPIELVQLNLVSCQPITVTTGGAPELWDVRVELSSNPLPPGNTGQMRAFKDDPNGGRFESFFFVQPLFTFTRVDPPHDQRFLDLPLLPGFDPLPFEGRPGGAPWAHQILVPNSVPCPAPNFVPGVNGSPPPGCSVAVQCCEEVGHAGPGHLHVTGTVCAPCECGACCETSTGACSLVIQAPPDSAETVCTNLGGDYKGPGTTCDDHDADGVPSVRESNDCCAGTTLGISDQCNVNSDPRNPDTDGDGDLDGAEVSLGFDPCSPLNAGFCCLPSGTCVGDPAFCGSEAPTPVSDCRFCIPRADDCWNTFCGDTRFDFCDQPIPSNFFDPGSDPFIGRIEFQGSPLPGPDTVVRRQDGMVLESPGESATVPIELVQLDLRSCQPIMVTIGGGFPELWDVRVTLSPNPLPPGNTGQMQVDKNHPDGGRFESNFFVQPLFTFTRVNPPHDERSLDLPTIPGFLPLPFAGQPGGAPWAHEVLVPNSVPCPAPNFVPGVNGDPPPGCTTDVQCCEEVGHAGPGHLHVTGTVCTPCECGACCDTTNGTCSLVIQSPPDSAETVCLNSGGEYKGAGTTCDDHDADGVPSVNETNDCCAGDLLGLGDVCNVHTDPSNPDTDGDSVSDGTEITNGSDPCQATFGTPNPPNPVTAYPYAAVKQRYVSFRPEIGHSATAYRVTDVGSGTAYYISTPRTTPASVAGQGLTFVVSDATPIIHDWTSTPFVQVGGCIIAPGDDPTLSTGRAYEIRATNDGAIFSAPLTVFTAARPTLLNARFWADIVGQFSAPGDGTTTPPTPPNSWTPPNRSVSGFDISASLQAAAAVPTRPHFTWADINPEIPDRVGAGPDVLRVVNAFSVGTGREFYPFAYPQTPTTIHHPITPPVPLLCPTPPLMAAINP